MMAAYYNEFDLFAAAWLRELIEAGMIPEGDVDERDIREVQPEDLRGYTQCHFFAGIGGWAYALRLAGWPDERPVWTGSPPCQPFSVAGKGLGKRDERHLAPVWLNLIRECRPPAIFGEQVAAAVTKDGWLDDLLDALEGAGYETGAVVVPAAAVGAPHIRSRLWFVGISKRAVDGTEKVESDAAKVGRNPESALFDKTKIHDDTEGAGNLENYSVGAPHSGVGGVADVQGERRDWCENPSWPAGWGGAENCYSDDKPSPPDSPWRDPDWLFCRDGKWRPVESSVQRLAHGIPGSVVQGGAFVPASSPLAPSPSKADRRVMRLKGYGNAIVPQVAAEVIRAFLDSRIRRSCSRATTSPGGAINWPSAASSTASSAGVSSATRKFTRWTKGRWSGGAFGNQSSSPR